MKISASSRYAHSEGLTSIFYDSVCSKFFTCGSDGDVRSWQNFKKDDDPVSYRIGDQATAIVVHNDKMYVADERGYIETFSLPDGTKDGFVTKFNEQVVHMEINSAGDHILAGSRDFSIKWSSTKDNSQVSFGLIDGHSAPVTSVALDPKEEFFASSSVDGSFKIWRLDDSSKPLKTMNVLEKCNDISPDRSLCRLKWHPKNAEILAVPVGRGIHLYGRNTWNLIKILENEEISDPISVLSFTKCGRFLAAGCLNGRLVVWDLDKKAILINEILTQKRTVCDLMWHPTDVDCLILCDVKGYVGIVKGIFSEPTTIVDEKISSAVDQYESFDIDDEATRDSDIGAIKSRYTSQIFGDDADDVATLDSDAATKVMLRQTVPASVPSVPSWKPQLVPEPFVVASTPKHLSERFMKWNSVGIVRQYNTENECSVDVEFHDASVHHALQLENTVSKYSMADLSVEALALASSADDTSKSRLYVLHFGSWDSSRDWSMDFPDGEDICCLCLGIGWVAVCTRKRNVSIFTVAGVQLKCFTISGPLVTMAGHCDRLLVAYVDGLDFKGNSKISCLSIYVSCDRYKFSATNVGLSLTCESSLFWLGFSTEGTPCLVDSQGSVRLYDNSVWIQIFDWKIEANNELDTIWITSIHEYSSQIRGVRCKRAKFPTFLPRPVSTVYSWRLNFLERDTEKSTNEEKFASFNMRRRHCASSDDVELAKNEFEAILKLFLLACNAERDCRALDVARLADSTTTLNVLINVASKKGRRVLAEKISDLARRRTAEEEEERIETHCESSSGTQPLFADDECDGIGEHPERNWNRENSTRIENPLRKFENKSISNLTLQSYGAVRNPFKKSAESDVNLKVKSIGESVFDNVTVSKKRPGSISNGTDLFSDEAKKRKTLTLKKQSKLSFSRQSSEINDEKKLIGLELFTKENIESLSQSFIGGDPIENSLKFKDHAKAAFIKLTDSERDNWNIRALSLLEKMESVEPDDSFISTGNPNNSQVSTVVEKSTKKLSMDSFAFSP